jgi:hypothetical protein
MMIRKIIIIVIIKLILIPYKLKTLKNGLNTHAIIYNLSNVSVVMVHKINDSNFNLNTTLHHHIKLYIFHMVFHTHILNYKNSSNKSQISTKMKIF